MKVADCIARVRTVSGDTTSAQFTDQHVIDWINDGIRECAINNNLLQKNGTQDTAVGTASYALPADILKLHSVKFDNIKLRLLTMEEFDKENSGVGTNVTTSAGTPNVAYVWANQLTLYPTPDAIKTLLISYLYDPVLHVLASASTDEIGLPVSYHPRIVDYCLSQVALQDDDTNRYQLFYDRFISGVRDLKDQPEYAYDLYPSLSIAARDMGDTYYGGVEDFS